MNLKSNKLVKNISKYLLLGVTAFSLLSGNVHAEYYSLYSYPIIKEQLAKGVVHEKHKVFTDGGWLFINVVKADIFSGAEIKVLSENEVIKRNTLTNIVKSSGNDVVAAVNGDFFDTKTSAALGTVIKDSRLIATSAGYKEYATFSIHMMGHPIIDYKNDKPNYILTYKADGISEDKRIQLNHYNKPYLGYNNINYYDKNFTKKSYGNTLGLDIIELVVKNNLIVESRKNMDPVNLADYDYIITGFGNSIAALEKDFKVGSKIGVEISGYYRFMREAVGGGTKLVSEGKLAKFTHNVTGYNPRTAVGIDKSGNNIIMVTVDGRGTSARGLSQTELADLMIKLGCYEAMNLDGGGSTQMVVKDPSTGKIRTANTPSDGTERRIYNALAVVSSKSDTQNTGGLQNQGNNQNSHNSSNNLTNGNSDNSSQNTDSGKNKIVTLIDFEPKKIIDGVVQNSSEGFSGKISVFPYNLIAGYREMNVDTSYGQSGVITYEFRHHDGDRTASLVFDKEQKLNNGVISLSVDVYGSQSGGHKLRAMLSDETGKIYPIEFSQAVIWAGWKTLTAEIPVSLSDKQLSLVSIDYYETDPAKKTFGYVIIDNITQKYDSTVVQQQDTKTDSIAENTPKIPPTEQLLTNSTKLVYVGKDFELTDNSLSLPQGAKLIKNIGFIADKNKVKLKEGTYTHSDKYATYIENDVRYIEVLNTGDGIRKNGWGQWQQIIKSLSGDEKLPVVIIMNDVYRYKDFYEKQLLLDLTKEAEQNGIDVIIVYSTANEEYYFENYEDSLIIKIPNSTDKVHNSVQIGMKDGKLYVQPVSVGNK